MAPPPTGAPGAAAQPAGAPPMDAPKGKGYLDPSKKYRQIGTLRFLSWVFTAATGVLAIIANVVGGSAIDFTAGTFLLGSGLIVGGIITGILATIWHETDEDMAKLINPVGFFYFASVFLMVVGGAIKANQLVIGTLYTGANVSTLVVAVLYGVMFLLYLEYLTAVRRFSQVGRMAMERNLKDFDLGNVIGHYMTRGFLLLGIIVAITGVVLGFHLLMINALASPQFAKSIELQSVYGIIMSEAVVFSLIGIVLAFAFSGQTGKEEIESIHAFSQSQAEQIAAGATQQTPAGLPGPAPGGRPLPPPPPGAPRAGGP